MAWKTKSRAKKAPVNALFKAVCVKTAALVAIALDCGRDFKPWHRMQLIAHCANAFSSGAAIGRRFNGLIC